MAPKPPSGAATQWGLEPLLGSESGAMPSSGSPAARSGTLPDPSLSEMGQPPSTMTSGPSTMSTSRVERILRKRMQKSQSSHSFNAEDEGQEFADAHSDGDEDESQRLILIANRLPVTAEQKPDGTWKLEISAGGLVSALLGVASFRTTWIGWPGIYVPEGPDRDQLAEALMAEGYIPVFLDESYVDMYYNGFCNQILWQLFHYVPLNLDSKLTETQTLQMQWEAYKAANKAFASVALDIYQEGDVVWCQDYHLMLVPELLKNSYPKMKVGWFLHTPFPSSEIYRTLPLREEVLRATLKADLIGFHTYDYARHFVSACTRILGLEGCPEGVIDGGQLTRVAAFPIGIDPDRFIKAMDMPQVRSHVSELLNRYAGRKVMLGVDRLDMIKGIPQKLLAYEKFLEEHPEWRDKVLLVQIAVPSRTDVPEYQKLRSMVHEIVGRINGKYGTLTHVPIHHLDRSLAFIELCALYAITDVLLVTSLRDGMNLVSYEYVACQSDNAGVLILSEFAGAAQSLGAGALLVNPWNIIDMAQAIEDALCMSDDERRERHRQMYMHVTIHTAQTWADTFIQELNDTHVENELRIRHVPPPLDIPTTVDAFRKAKGRRLLVLGCNSTLTQSVETPVAPKRHFAQIKAQRKITQMTAECVRKLSENDAVTLVIISGTDRKRLMENFGHLKTVWLVAENGLYMRPPPSVFPPRHSGDPWVCNLPSINSEDWKTAVQLVFEYFCERTPRSYMEIRESSIIWSYKFADAEFGRLQARDLLQHLRTGPISNAPVDIVEGARSVEARPASVSKGMGMQHLLAYMRAHAGQFAVDFDYIFAAGHFLGRDENLFAFLEGRNISGNQKETQGQSIYTGGQLPGGQGSLTVATYRSPRGDGGGDPVPAGGELQPSADSHQDRGAPPSTSDKQPEQTEPGSTSFLAQLVHARNRMQRQGISAPHSPRSQPGSPMRGMRHSADFHESGHDLSDLTGRLEAQFFDSTPSSLAEGGSSTNLLTHLVQVKTRLHMERHGASAPHSPGTTTPGSPGMWEAASTRRSAEFPVHGGIDPAVLRGRLDAHYRRSSTSSLPMPKARTTALMHLNSTNSRRESITSREVHNLPPRYLFTCNVGRMPSSARNSVSGNSEIEALLVQMVECLPHIPPLPAVVAHSSEEPSAGSSPASPKVMEADARSRLKTLQF
eukprot:CAMPEP_0117651800 /NCGR_PEP_ID=MMETSP0804-20121206/2286_1 /TAXON_ID=1074897 /ORGANISM="Tetraselmis astigmatica, Strain CCMP880" /LENGTH=1177 /DNA_ID=CAMNT_0005457803 /DNA_START=269 /DNA_END=3802 /DNA_ORIENTATION=-